MRWGLRIDVVEGKGDFILINLPAGNFVAQNLRKNILVIIGLGCVNRSEEHTSEIQSLMRNQYAVFCLNKKKDMQETYATQESPIVNIQPTNECLNDHT